MPLHYRFTCRLPNGIHARPASLLEEAARHFDSEIILTNERTGRYADCKSILSIVSADIRCDDPCVLQISGSDEPVALTQLSSFFEKVFPNCDDDSPVEVVTTGKLQLPPGLCDASLKYHEGIPVVPGIALGTIRRIDGLRLPSSLEFDPAKEPAAEWQVAEKSLAALEDFYGQQLEQARNKTALGMVKAHQAIARDPELRRKLREFILTQGQTLAGAIGQVQSHFSSALAGSKSQMLRERVMDVQDVCGQLFQEAYGRASNAETAILSSESVVVAEQLTPGQFLALDRKFLKGLVLANAGATSHTVILARSFGIPTLVGVQAVHQPGLEGLNAVVDGDAGILVLEPGTSAHRYYEMEFRRIAGREAYLEKNCAQPCTTKDGQRLEIGANVASPEESARAFTLGAEGIGLFRSEMLFLDRDSPPSEDEQFKYYLRLLKIAEGRPVIIRTLDVGGDKPLPYLNLPNEDNPALGYRAVRIYAEFETVFRTQIRALLRVSAHGRIKVMIPMITTVTEARWVRNIITGEQSRCAREGIAYDAALPVGAMIEIPSAAFSLESLARELDFFSIGTNDLLQYFTATDRTEIRLAHLYNPVDPAFLRLLKQVVDGARSLNRWIGLCGEMAAQKRLLPLLIGLGLDEISVSAPAIPDLKAELGSWKASECRRLLSAALRCPTAKEVDDLLTNAAVHTEAPLIDPELILMDVEAATKAEAIKLAADKLYILGRTNNSRDLEEAVWERERLGSTGFGHLFAIPHCKTQAVRFNSLVLMKFKTPVKWESLDDQPVKVMVLLAIRQSEAGTKHMSVLAKLARRIMDEQFREQIEAADTSEQICRIFADFLETAPLKT
jgi:phosphoenolpyruvate-protein phosphotransferase